MMGCMRVLAGAWEYGRTEGPIAEVDGGDSIQLRKKREKFGELTGDDAFVGGRPLSQRPAIRNQPGLFIIASSS